MKLTLEDNGTKVTIETDEDLHDGNTTSDPLDLIWERIFKPMLVAMTYSELTIQSFLNNQYKEEDE